MADTVDLIAAALDAVHVGSAAARAEELTYGDELRRLREGRGQRAVDAAARVRVAHHEAAHAVVAVKLGRLVQCVLLQPDGSSGETRFDNCPANLDPYVVTLVALAGPIGSLRAGEEITAQPLACRGDFLVARLALEEFAMTSREAAESACNLVAASWGKITRVAARLRTHGEVSGWDVLGLMHERRQ